MTQKVDIVMDFQYGSTGKGLIAGYLAKRGNYDTVACAFATNAGHTYVDQSQHLHLMTQQLPTGAVVSPTVKTILIGPGSLIHAPTLWNEIQSNKDRLAGKRIMIHPHAAVVEDYHANVEISDGMTKIGSTAKGVGAAMIERIKRAPKGANIAAERFLAWDEEAPGRLSAHGKLAQFVVTRQEYDAALLAAQEVLVEGAQGYSLSLYHGSYPYTTSRDVTPLQVLADIGAPFRWSKVTNVIGTCRTFPIRVNNRDGNSGPCFPDQVELDWSFFEDRGIGAEFTTVTKLKRRIFTFSEQQIQEAAMRCGGYWSTKIFLNFANYCWGGELDEIIQKIQRPSPGNGNPPEVAWFGYGPDDADVVAVQRHTAAG